MKKPISVLCILLCAVLLWGATAYAAAADLAPSAEIYAVMTLQSGREIVVEQAPTAAMMSAAESYELYVRKQSVLSVEHIPAATGDPGEEDQFYSIDFTFAGTDKEVYLTGLRAEYVEQIQQYIIDNYADGVSFAISDLGFIDAEKTYKEGDGDDYMCWAASCSDMLISSGWAAQAGFDSEDDLFEAFIGAFDDNGSHPYYALAWFFNGAKTLADRYGLALPKDYPDSGGYLNDYAFDLLTENKRISADMSGAAQALRDGRAVGLAVEIFDKGVDYGGHAVTMWGYVADNSVPEGDPARYLDIFITDSDSYEGIIGNNDADRRDAHDVMHMFALSEESGSYRFDFNSTQSGILLDYTSLVPYSEDAPKETDPDATRNKISDPDLSVGNIFITDSGSVRELKTRFFSGSPVSFTFEVHNTGDPRYYGKIYPQVTLTGGDGTVVYDRTQVFSVNINSMGYSVPYFCTAEDLPAGDYTLTCTINADRTASGVVPEAYYCNNTLSIGFTVTDDYYILGDYDGNREVNILDATKIQRKLAAFTVNTDDNAEKRGDINGGGLDIIDVTLIQRRLAELDDDHPIGERFFYEDT